MRLGGGRRCGGEGIYKAFAPFRTFEGKKKSKTTIEMSIRGISLLAASALSVFAAPVRVLNVDFPDPSLIKTDDGWYSFATAGNGVQIQVATSSDFKTWELLKGHDAIPGPFPDWTKKEGPEVWAPDVIKRVRLFPPN